MAVFGHVITLGQSQTDNIKRMIRIESQIKFLVLRFVDRCSLKIILRMFCISTLSMLKETILKKLNKSHSIICIESYFFLILTLIKHF